MTALGKIARILLAVALLALIALGAGLEALDEQNVPEPVRAEMGVGR